MFTFFEQCTVSLLYLLNCCFEETHVFKPSTSKSGNSEVYVICLRFKGLEVLNHIWEALILPYKSPHSNTNKALFNINDMNSEYLIQISDCAEFFMRLQINTIESNITNYNKYEANEMEKIQQRKKLVAFRYIKKYCVQKIPCEKKLVPSITNLNVLSYCDIQYKISNIWCLNKDSVEFNRNSLNCDKKLCDILNIKFGKPLEKIVHSNFCSKDYLLKLNVTDFKDEDCAYLTDTSKSYINMRVISIADFLDNIKQCDFHVALFQTIKNHMLQKGEIVFVKIPFVTNFLVGILYLLLFAFEKVVFHKNGCIVMSEWCLRVKEVNECFDLIDSAFKDRSNKIGEDDKVLDINQIIPLSVLYNPKFFNLVWNYNNAICGK